MRNKYRVIASFETSDKKRAEEIKKEVADLLQKQVEDGDFARGEVGLQMNLEGEAEPAMVLGCDDIFSIEPDTL